jgi:hypothetical protein
MDVTAITDQKSLPDQTTKRLILSYRSAGFATCGEYVLRLARLHDRSTERNASMRVLKLAIVIAMIAAALFLTLPNLSWALK